MPDFIASDGTRLHYDDTGTGLPVLALAGLTRNGADFDHVAPHLACRLIRLDYRGRGRSDWADPATYTVPVEAQDALALLDHLGLDRVAILGTSRGGLIGMMLAATAHDRLSGLALNDIGPVIDPHGLAVITGYVGRNPAQKTHADAAAFRAAHWAAFKGVPMDRWLAEVAQHYDQTAEGLVIRYDPALAQTLGDGKTGMPDLWPIYDATAGLPLAAIRGANSDLLSVATWEEMQRRRPDGIFTTVPDRGHVPFLDEPAALDALHRWLGQMA
ncbi:Pimeloyl-ACP methyl ester carboxylesterase [Loktanella fryxellensis]|uniref:Pimeloyl-ACP methyl ester carboxylesterase n=1 Tax=Loktanella fryxellensis TaxID=245187 RepID=A0A1H8AAL8_9RHOB|nr:alpha/beta hydrolase [Loktanella fryxellensis]SEM66848.1 Pimeloyl-ACP methyl ester carboxylesterase [Loktanella fryxellensis]